MDQSTHEVRNRQWAEMIRQCNVSGLSRKEWCRQNGISTKTFYYRQRQLRKEVYDLQAENSLSGQVEFAEIPALPTDGEKAEPFRPDAIIRTPFMTIEVTSQASPEVLEMIGKVIGHAS